MVVACAGHSSVAASHPSTPTDASGLPTERAVARSDLTRLPEAHIRFLGAVVVKAVGTDQKSNGDPQDPDPAYTGEILVARTTPSALFAWYGAILTGRGFSPAVYLPSSDQTAGEAWQFHHRLQVQVGVFDPPELKADRGISPHLSPGTIVYEAVLVGYLPGLPRY